MKITTPSFCLILTGLSITLQSPAADMSRESAKATEGMEQLGEVIVTAQRREERLVDVPISVTAISQQDLELKRIDSINDLTRVVTSLRFEGQAPSFQPTLRGIGSLVQGGGVDTSVAVYVDGVYLPNTQGMNFDFPNVSNIQVLKGPQGTLFGRNTTGGAILISTAPPSSELSGRIKTTYERFNDVRVQSYLSGPLMDNLLGGISVYYRNTPGYFKNIATGAHDARARMLDIRPDLLFKISDDVNVRLIYEHSYSADTTTLGLTNPDGYALARLIPIPGVLISDSYGEYAANQRPMDLNKADALSATVDWKFGSSLALKSVTSYRRDSNEFWSDADMSNLPILAVTTGTRFKTFSQEFTLGGKTGALDWVVGAHYWHNTAAEPNVEVIYGPPIFPAITPVVVKSDKVTTDAVAGFADATYEVGNGLFLTAGGRYSSERKQMSLLPGGVGPEITDQRRWNSFTPRAVIRYQFDPSDNIYFSYSKGFKSGAYTGYPPNLVDPEKVNAFEAGVKHGSAMFDLSAAVFLYNNRDFQVTTFDFTTAQGKVINADKARSYGAEVELALRPTSNWRVSLAGAYLNAKFIDFPASATGGATIQAQLPIAPGQWVSVPQDASGTVEPRSPKWSGNLSTSYDIPVSAGTFQVAGNVAFSSRFFNMVNEQFPEPGYAEIGLNGSFTTRDGHWRGEVFVTNLTDHLRRAQYQGGPFGTYALWFPPRVYGASLSYNF